MQLTSPNQSCDLTILCVGLMAFNLCLMLIQESASHPLTCSGDFIIGVTPVPIPNTAVKPDRADDTGIPGKVGRRRNQKEQARLVRAFSFSTLIFHLLFANSLAIPRRARHVRAFSVWYRTLCMYRLPTSRGTGQRMGHPTPPFGRSGL